MAKWTYDESLRRLLVHEGDYTNHPSDPGGPTNWGITIHDARKYWQSGATAADVKAMPVSVAKAIYKSKYWDAMRCDELPAGIDYCVFDYGVNSGTGRAPKVLQRVLGVAVDGEIGPETLDAGARRDAKSVVGAICDERLRFLQSLKTWPVFGNGWGRRVREVRAAALAMAGRTTMVAMVPGASAVRGKGAVPVNRNAQGGTAGGAAVAGGAVATQASEPAIVVIVVVATVVVAIGAWFFWRWWQTRRQDAPA